MSDVIVPRNFKLLDEVCAHSRDHACFYSIFLLNVA